MQVQKFPPRSGSGSALSAHSSSEARGSCRADSHNGGSSCLGPWSLCHSSCCQGACSQHSSYSWSVMQRSVAPTRMKSLHAPCLPKAPSSMAAQVLWMTACLQLLVDRAADATGHEGMGRYENACMHGFCLQTAMQIVCDDWLRLQQLPSAATGH